MQASKDMTRMYGGPGLGLATVKLLLEPHHSEVKVNSKNSEGTEFLFHLSFNYTMCTDGLANKAKLQKKLNDLTHLRVMVAEDNPVNMSLLKKLFTRWNIESIVAENGQEVVDRKTAV